MSGRPAASVAALLDEATARWPDRSRTADGTMASAAHHQANPSSDHEPDARGVGHAVDLTHDPSAGVDCQVLAEQLRARQDRRIRYVIWDRRIFFGRWTSKPASWPRWTWQPYTGPSPHDHHMHVSVGHHAAAESDTSPWFSEPQPQEVSDVPLTQAEYVWLRKLSTDTRKDTRQAIAASEARLAGRLAALEQLLHASAGVLEVSSPDAPDLEL